MTEAEREPDSRPKGSIATELSSIEWEYVPERDTVSLFEPMGSFFEDFPWEGSPRPRKREPVDPSEAAEGLRRLVGNDDD